MFDCGVHPGLTGMASLPFFDEVDMASVDVILITHFHLDHCAALPYVVGHTPFKGRILMTHATKAVVATLLRDFVRVSKTNPAVPPLYTDADLDAALAATEVADFHQTIHLDPAVAVTPRRAGHVLGAAMFDVDVAGLRVLYTGDYSRVADRHMPPADAPPRPPHALIVEATYGVSRHVPRGEREARFVEKVTSIVARGGRVLLPVVALGRAQELLLILEEHWAAHPDLHRVPIYQASGLARKALTVYQTYIDAMNDAIRAAFATANPFVFKHVTHLRHASALDDGGPCVVLATPSMLQSGLSRDLFDAWCEDARNGVIIADFAVAGTLARDILAAPDTVVTRAGARVPLRASVDAISFSAHADFDQTAGFVDELSPPHVVLVHGEAGEMKRLQRALEARATAGGVTRAVYSPKVGQPVHLRLAPAHPARVVGRLADKPPREGGRLAGLVVRGGGGGGGGTGVVIVDPSDLPSFTGLAAARVKQRQALPLAAPFGEVRLALEVLFDGVGGGADLGGVSASKRRSHPPPSSVPGSGGDSLVVAGAVTVTHDPVGGAGGTPQLVLEWDGGGGADAVADAVVAAALSAGGEPPAVAAAQTERGAALAAGDADAVATADARLLAAVLAAQFGGARIVVVEGEGGDDDSEGLAVAVDAGGGASPILIDATTGSVAGKPKEEASPLAGRVEAAAKRLVAALAPLAASTE